jgi:hypothetical protein
VFIRADWRFIHEYYTGMAAHMLHQRFGKKLQLHDAKSIIAFEDHTNYVEQSPAHLKAGLVPNIHAMCAAHRTFVADNQLTHYRALTEGEAALEDAVHQSVSATALGHELNPPGRDGARKRNVAGIGKVFEFTGSVVAQLKTDERSTLTNMTAELGGLTGIVAPDAETLRFLKERRGVDFSIEDWMHSDANAVYADTITIDCSQLTPMLAAPGDTGNGIALANLKEPIKVHIAYGGSCTAGKREDFDHYHAVLHWAAQRGLKVPDGVTLYLQFGTTAVRDYCVAHGYMDAFNKVGAQILQPSCGACANCGPGSSIDSSQVTISAINRNFPGRSGPGQVWLASPPTVVASAIAGEICSFAQLQQRCA